MGLSLHHPGWVTAVVCAMIVLVIYIAVFIVVLAYLQFPIIAVIGVSYGTWRAHKLYKMTRAEVLREQILKNDAERALGVAEQMSRSATPLTPESLVNSNTND